MSDTITLDFIGRQQAQILAEVRDLRGELRDIRAEQKGIRTYIGARAAETETLMQHLFDRLNERLDQSERSVEERLRKLEGGE